MTTLSVEIDRERDLPALQALLTRMGLKFRLEDDLWNGLSDAEIECIQAGLDDIEAGRVHTRAEVLSHIDKKINDLRSRNGK